MLCETVSFELRSEVGEGPEGDSGKSSKGWDQRVRGRVWKAQFVEPHKPFQEFWHLLWVRSIPHCSIFFRGEKRSDFVLKNHSGCSVENEPRGQALKQEEL